MSGESHIYCNPKVIPSRATFTRKSVVTDAQTKGRVEPSAKTGHDTSSSALTSIFSTNSSYAGNASACRDLAVADCRKFCGIIAQQCESAQKPFFDVDFCFDERKNLYPPGTPEDSAVAEPRQVRRISDAATFSDRVFIGQELSTVNMTQGAIGDCFLLGALAALASAPTAPHRSLIGECFAYVNTAYGIFGVIFFKNGGWEWVIVDDVIPVQDDMQTPLYGSSLELWPMILEKAYAKLHHCWDNIDGGWVNEALVDLTGGRSYHFDLHRGKYRDSKGKCTFSFDYFRTLAQEELAVTVCSIGEQFFDSADEDGRVHGVLCGHAYSVIGIAGAESSGDAAVCVRNPWGERGHVDSHFEFAQTSVQQGIFWMTWAKFRDFFTDIHVCCALEPEMQQLTVFGKGNGSRQRMSKFILTIGNNSSSFDASSSPSPSILSPPSGGHQYPIALTLFQPDPKTLLDHRQAKTLQYAVIKFEILKWSKKGENQRPLSPSNSEEMEQTLQQCESILSRKVFARQCDEELSLEEGQYLLCTELQDSPALGLHFCCRVEVAPNIAVSLARFDEPEDCIQSIPVYMLHPQRNNDSHNPQLLQTLSEEAKKYMHCQNKAGKVVGPSMTTDQPNSSQTMRNLAVKFQSNGTVIHQATRSSMKALSQKQHFTATAREAKEQAMTQCKRCFDGIVNTCEEVQKKFFDRSFFVGFTQPVLFSKNHRCGHSFNPACIPVNAARMTELFPGAWLFPPPHKDTNTASNAAAGAISNDYFFATMDFLQAAGVSPADLIVCHSQKWGIFGVIFFKNGGWEWVIVDDVIPVQDDMQTPLYGSSLELWPMILEKAYAKLHHCWDNIDGGWVNEALVDLTGATSFSIALESTSANPVEIQTFIRSLLKTQQHQKQSSLGSKYVLTCTTKREGPSPLHVGRPFQLLDLSTASGDPVVHMRSAITRAVDLQWAWRDFRQFFVTVEVCLIPEWSDNVLTCFVDALPMEVLARSPYLLASPIKTQQDQQDQATQKGNNEEGPMEGTEGGRKVEQRFKLFVKSSSLPVIPITFHVCQFSPAMSCNPVESKEHRLALFPPIRLFKLGPGEGGAGGPNIESQVPSRQANTIYARSTGEMWELNSESSYYVSLQMQSDFYIQIFSPPGTSVTLSHVDSAQPILTTPGYTMSGPAARALKGTPTTPNRLGRQPTPTGIGLSYNPLQQRPPSNGSQRPHGSRGLRTPPTTLNQEGGRMVPSSSSTSLSFQKSGGVEKNVSAAFELADPWHRQMIDRRMAEQAFAQLLMHSDVGLRFSSRAASLGQISASQFSELVTNVLHTSM